MAHSPDEASKRTLRSSVSPGGGAKADTVFRLNDTDKTPLLGTPKEGKETASGLQVRSPGLQPSHGPGPAAVMIQLPTLPPGPVAID